MSIITATETSSSYASKRTFFLRNRLHPSTITASSYWNPALQCDAVDIEVGIVPNGQSNFVRRVITVPARRLLNGRKVDCIRCVRFNVLMGILTSYAKEAWSVNFETESIVFLGFRSRG